MHDAAVDRERVVEALVTLDELLDRDRLHALAAEPAQRCVERGVAVDAGGVERACASARRMSSAAAAAR